jgi:hypothetical protein
MGIAQQNFMIDVLFDNVFSDMKMRDIIRDSQQQLMNAQQALNGQLRAANQRIRVEQAGADQAKLVLDGKREELQRVRAEAFNRIAGGASADGPPGYEGAPPSYEA